MAPQKPADTTEYRFKIDAYSPETIPMARLAQYMAELASMLGEEKSVHFHRLARGSTVLVSRVEREAVPKVMDRATAVRRQQAPPEALKAYRAINKLLREDNAVGTFKRQRGVIIRFPGREEEPEKYPPIRQHGTFDGTLVALGGGSDVHVRLLVEGVVLSGFFTTDRLIGKQMARHFDEPVRLIGWGNWNRDAEGKWVLLNFKIEHFEPLKPISLSEALAELRALPLKLEGGAYDELELIRHGPPSVANGGH